MKTYLGGWKLNAARVLDALIDVVEANCGYQTEKWPFPQSPTPKYAVVDECYPGTRVLGLRALTHLSFVHNGIYYYVQLGNNPFLSCSYLKEIPDKDKVSSAQIAEDLSLEWFVGKSEYAYLSDEEVNKNAVSLFEFLLNASLTETTAKKTYEIRRKDK